VNWEEQDPRGWAIQTWMTVLEVLVRKLGEKVNTSVEIGPYWLDTGFNSASASLGVRIRANDPLLWVASDCWEAALCITGGSEGIYADVIAFPFLEESVVTRRGRMAAMAVQDDVDEFWLQYADGTWNERGWRYPDGAGEWNHVCVPGTAFFRSLNLVMEKSSFQINEEIMAYVELCDIQELDMISEWRIHKLCRNSLEIVSPPSKSRLSKLENSIRLPYGSQKQPFALPISELQIPGGWIKGIYEIDFRLTRTVVPTSVESHLSEMVVFEIVLQGLMVKVYINTGVYEA
jgi:hypothetical protein